MLRRKASLTSFNSFFAIVVLVPSVYLLYQFFGELNTVCDMSNHVVYYTIVVSCMSLLALMTLIKELLTFD